MCEMKEKREKMTYCHTSEEIWLIKNKFKVLFFGGVKILSINDRNSAYRVDG